MSGDDDWFEDSPDDPFEADSGEMLESDDGPSTADFAEALGGAPSDAGIDDGFDEDLDSDIPRIDLGIDGLDEMIQGGVPERSLLAVIGSAGTGKTTFGIQFLQQGLKNDEKGVYITLEEDRNAVLRAAEEKGWSFEDHIESGELAVVDLDPIEMSNSLTSIRGDLTRLIESFGADRLVLDSVSLLEMMYDKQSDRRTEVFDFARSLKRAGVTTMVTSEADSSDPYTSKYGIIEYLTDGVFILQYVRSEFGETRMAVEIQKIRNANHSRETKPYEITSEGISVYKQADIF
ncbi:MAG: KaiC domain-containing protein [Natronomonas sp.]